MIAMFLFAAATASTPVETAIPNVASNGIEQWQVDGSRGIWLKSITSKWYYATFQGPCRRAGTALSLGFVTAGLDELDRNGAILAEGSRCSAEQPRRIDGTAANAGKAIEKANGPESRESLRAVAQAA